MADDIEQFYKEPSKKEWRGFWTLVAVQAQNAFNEKAVQFLLIPLGVWLWGASGSTLEYTLGAIFVLPYILFSPLVGWLADCFCKTRIIQVMCLLQIFVMSCMQFCFYMHDMTAAIIWFTVFATQATILSPAKKGIVKDLLGSRYISFGSGIIEMSMVFVLLVAQIGVFFWFSYLLDAYSAQPDGAVEAGWSAVKLPTWVFLSLASVVAVASFFLPRYAVKPPRPFSWSLLWEHFTQVKYLWRDRNLRLSEMGICYFWCLAGSLFLILIQIAKAMQAADPNVNFSLECGILMAWLTGGVVVGGVTASRLCKGANELGLIPLGAIGITVSTLLLAMLPVNTLPSNILLALTGAFGAAYLVPLNAYLQDNCDPSNRGNIIAAGNLIDNLMGLVAVALMWLMYQFGASPQMQFFVLFLISLFILISALRLIPQDFIRMLGMWFMHLFYRARVLNVDRIPERGGALLVVNHVTYADALFLTMVVRRPIRFIVDEEFTSVRFVGWILELFNSLPISSSNPRHAIHEAEKGLENGDIICIFPEGQLTRHGCITPIRRGVEVITRRAKVPVIPIYMDGLWGSVFSYFGNRFFTKLPLRYPYPYTVAVGEPFTPRECSADSVMRSFRSLSAQCLETTDASSRDGLIRHLEQMGNAPLVHAQGGQCLTGFQVAAALISREPGEDWDPLLVRWMELLQEASKDILPLHRYWMNVQQVCRVNALKPGVPVLATVGHQEPQELVLSVLWPVVTHTPVYLVETPQEMLPAEVDQMVGGTHMRGILFKSIPHHQAPFFDFSGGSAISTPNMRWRPCLATPRHIIISMSMCRSVFKIGDGTSQLGTRPRTRGILLPGFAILGAREQGGTSVCGPSLLSAFSLPDNLYLDESGFLAELS